MLETKGASGVISRVVGGGAKQEGGKLISCRKKGHERHTNVWCTRYGTREGADGIEGGGCLKSPFINYEWRTSLSGRAKVTRAGWERADVSKFTLWRNALVDVRKGRKIAHEGNRQWVIHSLTPHSSTRKPRKGGWGVGKALHEKKRRIAA